MVLLPAARAALRYQRWQRASAALLSLAARFSAPRAPNDV